MAQHTSPVLRPSRVSSRRAAWRLTSALAAASLVAGALAVAAPAAAADPPAFASSFEDGQTPPAASTPYDPAVNVTGKKFTPGSLLPLVTAVTASGQNLPNEGAVLVSDGNKSTKWLVFATTGWVQYQLSAPTAVTAYTLTSANDDPTRDPKDFVLRGSNDGSSWVPVDTRTGQTWKQGSQDNRGVTKTYTVTGAAAYSSYRLDVSANNGSSTIIQLADWELIGDPGQTVPTTPMVTEVGNGPASSPTAKTGYGFTGARSLRYGGAHVGDGAATASNLLFDGVGVPVAAGTQLSYKVFPILDADLSYPATYVAVDLVLDDGTRLSGTEPTDAYGEPADARGQGASKILVPNQWNSVTVDLGALAGRTVVSVLLSYDNPTGGAATAFSGWLDDVTIGAATPRDTSDGFVSLVDTRRGTNSSTSYSRGNNIPATAWPNGFNFFVPMTNGSSTGTLYEYSRQNNGQNLPELEGIGISHEPSPWMGDRNQLAVIPSSSASPTSRLDDRELAFRHEDEVARPDVYSVEFTNGLATAVTPTDHGGVYRFTFPGTVGSVVVDKVSGDSGLTISPAGVLTGWVDGGSGYPGRTRMFVYGRFDATPTAAGATTVGDRNASARYAAFDTGADGEVLLRLATSFISQDQASRNFDLEVAGRGFDEVRAAATQAWDDRLGVVEVEGASDTQRVTLYSSLYRLNLYPNSQFENTGTAADPVYRYASPVSPTTGAATDTQTNARVVDGKIYVNNGFWDTYRTAWPLYSLLYPDVADQLVDGFVQQYRDGGWVARWSSPGYADLMTGTSSDVSFAEAYLADALGVDLGIDAVLDAYDAAVKNATVLPTSNAVGRKGLDTSIFLGWTPSSTGQSASWGLEGFVNDFGIAQMAQALADDPRTPAERVDQLREDARYFTDRSKNYVTMFNPLAGVFTSRNADGTFSDGAGFDKAAWGGAYTEASGWTFAFHAPFDVDGLAALYGGRAGLVAELDEFLATPETAAHSGIHEAFEARDVRLGMLGMSNQVAHHIPYIYAAAGDASKTQALVREITQRLFAGSDIGQGYLGDEDNGEMSSWYVFSALGFYPLAVGSGDYTVGSPVFDRATVHLAGGDLVVDAPGASAGEVYIDGATFDGAPLTGTSLSGDLLRGGGTLAFSMSETPSTWGDEDLDAPLAVPAVLVDATKPGFGTLSAADGTPVAALADDNSRSTVTFPAGSAQLVWHSTSGPVVVDQYTLTNTSAGAGDPASWTLEGSDDGEHWTVLDARDGQAFRWATQTRPLSVAAPSSWTDYRLTVSAAAGQPLALAEVELFATAGESGDLSLTAASPVRARVGTEVTATLATVVGGGETASDHAVTVDYLDGSGPQPAILTANGLGGWSVSAPHTFAEPGVYAARITASAAGSPGTVGAVATVTVWRDETLVGAFDAVCLGDLGTTAASCDGQGYGYFRDKLAATGFVQGTTVAVPGTDLTFDLPAVAPGAPDNVTGEGQTIRLDLGAGAERISLVGTATEAAKDLVGTLTYSDGTTEPIPVQFGDWVGASGSPAFGNVVVGMSAGRLAGTSAEGSVKNSAIFATVPHDLARDGEGVAKTVVALTLPAETGTLRDGRSHLFAVASDGDRSALAPLEVTASAVPVQEPGVAFDAELARATGGFGLDGATAVVGWGDGTVVDRVPLAGGAVTGGHTYAEAGTYTVSVTVDDGVTSASAAVPVEVREQAPVYAPSIAVAPAQVAPGEPVTVTGTGFAPGETVTVALATATPVTTTATAGGAGELTATLVVPADAMDGTYPVSAVGDVSATPASATVVVVAPAPGPQGTSVSLAASAASPVVGVAFRLTATVTPGGAAGEVRLTEGGEVVGTASVAGGTAVADVVASTTGEHRYAATFVPADPRLFTGSTSAEVVVDVRPAPPTAPTVELSLGTVVAGGELRVSGTGFLPGEVVTAVLHSDPVTLGSVAADGSGAFALTVTVPRTVTPGAHTLVVTGATSGLSAQAPVTVTAAPGSLPDTGGGPGRTGADGRLPWTGADGVGPLALVAVLLLLAGAAAVTVVVRRRRATPEPAGGPGDEHDPWHPFPPVP